MERESLDDAILALERRVREGDTSARAQIDELLYRSERQPRRIWYVWHTTGEYSDYNADVEEPGHFTKQGALEHMKRLAAEKEYTRHPDDPERYEKMDSYDYHIGTMSILTLDLER